MKAEHSFLFYTPVPPSERNCESGSFLLNSVASKPQGRQHDKTWALLVHGGRNSPPWPADLEGAYGIRAVSAVQKPQLRPPRCDSRVTPEEKRRFLARRAQETEQRLALFNAETETT
jgi:hypothetical protein